MAADGLKQRLVGGATLLMVAVVAWFWLLSADSPVDPVSQESQIPTAPDIKPFAVQEPTAPQGIEPIGSERDSQPALQSDAVPQSPSQIQAQSQLRTLAEAKAQAARASSTATAMPASTQPAGTQAANTQSANKQPAKPQAEIAVSAAAAANKASAASKTGADVKTNAVAKATVVAKTGESAAAVKADAKTAPASKLVPETFQLDQHGLPIAWVVQVGVFSTQATADKIKATLQEKGFKAYTEPFKRDKVSGVKVVVGPKLSRERAEAQKQAIDQLLKTNTMVVRFTTN
jgi:hypothetical protein